MMDVRQLMRPGQVTVKDLQAMHAWAARKPYWLWAAIGRALDRLTAALHRRDLPK
jgi:hypothetical protein